MKIYKQKSHYFVEVAIEDKNKNANLFGWFVHWMENIAGDHKGIKILRYN